MRKKTILAGAAALFFVVGIYLLYALIDQSMTLDHSRQARASIEQDRALLRRLVLDLSRDAKRTDWPDFIRTNYARDHIVKEEGRNIIVVDGVELHFRGDELTDISFMDTPTANLPGPSSQ